MAIGTKFGPTKIFLVLHPDGTKIPVEMRYQTPLKLKKIWIKTFFSENAKKIMDFGGLAYSGSSWELIFGFLSVPNASWVSVLPTKPAGKVWATSKKFFWGGCTNTMKSLSGLFVLETQAQLIPSVVASNLSPSLDHLDTK